MVRELLERLCKWYLRKGMVKDNMQRYQLVIDTNNNHIERRGVDNE